MTPPPAGDTVCADCDRIADTITPVGPHGRLHCTCPCGAVWIAQGV